MNRVADALRRGAEVADPLFDLVFPPDQRFRSWVHWTPLDVATRACQLLAWKPGARILDIGSGVGKLCLVGALTTDATWIGLEQDRHMVAGARSAAQKLGLQHRATFIEADVTRDDWPEFDSVYMYNPFAERLFAASRNDPQASRDTYSASVYAVQCRLASAKPGTRVVTYFGFGGDMPSSYELLHRERARDDELRVWVR